MLYHRNLRNAVLDRSVDLDEIKDKEDELIKSAQGFFDEFVNKEIAVDYSRAVKIYIDTNIYENNILSSDIVNNILKDANYLWEVPIKVSEGEYVICTVSRKPPITDETKQDLLENQIYTKEELEEAETRVGQWIIALSSYDETKSDYIDTINSILNENYKPNDTNQIYLLGGTPNMRLPFALFEEDGSYKVMILDTGVLNNDAETFSAAPADNLQENNIYDFETIQEVISELPDESDIGDEGYGVIKQEIKDKKVAKGIKIVLFICIITMIALAIIIYCFKRKIIANKNESAENLNNNQ